MIALDGEDVKLSELRGCDTQTQAEKAAWNYVKQHGIDMVTINPSFVLGPTMSKRTDGESIQALVVSDAQAFFPRSVLSAANSVHFFYLSKKDDAQAPVYA